MQLPLKTNIKKQSIHTGRFVKTTDA